MGSKKVKFCVVVLLVSLQLFSFQKSSLPENEEMALQRLEDGELDSSLWYLIEPFYSQPLSVPYGELRIIRDIFPNISQDAPVSEIALSKYLPWGKKNIQDFFFDWPELKFLEPIFDFSMTTPLKVGRAGFFISKDIGHNNSNQKIQFSLMPGRWFEFHGRVGVTERYARWNSRKISITPTPWCALNIGVSNPVNDPGLITGYFPKEINQDSSLSSNWLYGDARGWNSIYLQMMHYYSEQRIIFQPFFHKRESETVAGISGSIGIGKTLFNEINFIAVAPLDDSDTTLYVAYNTQVKINTWNLQVSVCSPVKKIPVVPVYLKWSYKKEQDEFKSELVYLPTGYSASRSALVESFRKTGENSEPLENDILHYECIFKHSFSTMFLMSPLFDVTISDYVTSSMSTGVRIFGSIKGNMYQLSYNWSIPEMQVSKDGINKYSCEFISIINTKLDAALDVTVTKSTKNTVTTKSSLKTEYKINNNISISPKVVCRSYSQESGEILFCLANKMKLFESTYTDVAIENSYRKNNKKGSFRVFAKMWFLF